MQGLTSTTLQVFSFLTYILRVSPNSPTPNSVSWTQNLISKGGWGLGKPGLFGSVSCHENKFYHEVSKTLMTALLILSLRLNLGSKSDEIT